MDVNGSMFIAPTHVILTGSGPAWPLQLQPFAAARLKEALVPGEGPRPRHGATGDAGGW